MGCAQKKYKVQREDTCVYVIEMGQMRRQDGARKKVHTRGLELAPYVKRRGMSTIKLKGQQCYHQQCKYDQIKYIQSYLR